MNYNILGQDPEDVPLSREKNDSDAEGFPNLSDSLNPKVLFREYFTVKNPDQDEASDFICTILHVTGYQVEHAFSALGASEVQEVDDNLFTALWLFLWSPEMDEIEKEFLCNSWKSPCSKCKTALQSNHFLNATGGDLLMRCARCRGERLCCGGSPVLVSRISFADNTPRILIYRWHAITFRASIVLNLGYNCTFIGRKEHFL